MDENEQQGGLAQAVAPAESTTVPSAPLTAVPAAKPEPSEYEKALLSYQNQRQELIKQQQALIASLEARVGGPSEMLFALAQGFSAPSRTGSFGESLGYATQALGSQQEKSRQAMSDIAKMRMELAASQVGMAKEDIELARNREASKGLQQIISGSSGQSSGMASIPPEVAASIQNRLAVNDLKGAQDLYEKYILESIKKPEKVKEFEFYVGQLKSPAARSIAQQMAANNYFLGSPTDRTKTILDIRKAIDKKTIPENEGNLLIQGLTSIGGEQGATAAAPDGVYRSTRPTEQEARNAAINADAAGVPFSISVQPKSVSPSAAVVTGPQSVSGVQSQPDQSILSNEQKRSIEVKRQEAEIGAQAAAREQAYKKLDESLRDSESKASSAASTIGALDRFLESSPSAAAGGLQPLLTNVKNLLSSFGISADSLVNEQKMSAAIDQILMGKMESMGSAARGLTNQDMESMRNSLPRINTDRRAREEVARIVKKARASDIEDYRIHRINESENFPDIARVRPAPRFYLDWIKKTEDFNQLKRQYDSATTTEAKNDVMNRFDRYYGIGVSRQILR